MMPEEPKHSMKKTAATRRRAAPQTPSEKLYTLDVFLTGGPVMEEFLEQNPVVKRAIEIRGDQTLTALHQAIFEAFDREEEHMYEFQFGKRPDDPKGPRYGLPMDDDESVGDVTVTRLDDLNIDVDRAFGYWFDFGDDWYHQINVRAIGKPEPKVRYPRVTERVGESPPQYPDWDDEDEDEDDEE